MTEITVSHKKGGGATSRYTDVFIRNYEFDILPSNMIQEQVRLK